jgi:hypothetical protein
MSSGFLSPAQAASASPMKENKHNFVALLPTELTPSVHTLIAGAMREVLNRI